MGVGAERNDAALFSNGIGAGRLRVRSLAGRSLAVAVLMAFAVLLALPVQADTPATGADASQSTDPREGTQTARAPGATEGAQEVPLDWSLIPDGLGAGDEFRLLFLSSTVRVATSNMISPYNSFIQDLAAAGHADVQTYSSGFTVVGCTFNVDARDNTNTTYTDSDKGVPIYWLGVDRKVADDYQDFYDGSWTNESSNRNEFGSGNRDTAQSENQPFTGCYNDGTGVTQWHLPDPRRRRGLPTAPVPNRSARQLHLRRRPHRRRVSRPRCQLTPLIRALGGLPRGLPRRDAERAGRAER